MLVFRISNDDPWKSSVGPSHQVILICSQVCEPLITEQTSSRLPCPIHLAHHLPNMSPSLFHVTPDEMPSKFISAFRTHFKCFNGEHSLVRADTKTPYLTRYVVNTLPMNVLLQVNWFSHAVRGIPIGYFVCAVSLTCEAFLIVLCLLRSYPCAKYHRLGGLKKLSRDLSQSSEA